MAKSKVIDCSVNTYSFLSITLTVAGINLASYLKTLEYGEKRDKKTIFGNGTMPVGIVPGTYQATCAFEFLTRESFDEFTTKVPNWADQTFNVVSSYAEAGKKTITDTIQQVQFTGNSVSASGTDAVPVKCECIVAGKIKWNGKESTAA